MKGIEDCIKEITRTMISNYEKNVVIIDDLFEK
jgi:hypothetical protein